MNAKDLRSKSTQELLDEIKSLLREQFNLRMQKGLSEGLKTHQFKLVRRAVARVKTILAERERENG
ncbi:MAG: 50S ribosomal protein L29 [Gammaproteobacteria bacterium]|nr:50S ribosomal protein L29 [Gammaproteobacteria bacterium]